MALGGPRRCANLRFTFVNILLFISFAYFSILICMFFNNLAKISDYFPCAFPFFLPTYPAYSHPALHTLSLSPQVVESLVNSLMRRNISKVLFVLRITSAHTHVNVCLFVWVRCLFSCASCACVSRPHLVLTLIGVPTENGLLMCEYAHKC